jgi:hypothetical protein
MYRQYSIWTMAPNYLGFSAHIGILHPPSSQEDQKSQRSVRVGRKDAAGASVAEYRGDAEEQNYFVRFLPTKSAARLIPPRGVGVARNQYAEVERVFTQDDVKKTPRLPEVTVTLAALALSLIRAVGPRRSCLLRNRTRTLGSTFTHNSSLTTKPGPPKPSTLYIYVIKISAPSIRIEFPRNKKMSPNRFTYHLPGGESRRPDPPWPLHRSPRKNITFRGIKPLTIAFRQSPLIRLKPWRGWLVLHART